MTKKVFHDLAIFMVGFGLFIGLVFPFFTLALGIPKEYVLKPVFVILCVLAGIFVGAVNILLARRVVGRRIRLLAQKMNQVKTTLANKEHSEIACSELECSVPVDSEDELGDAAKAFNALVKALANSHSTEKNIKEFTQAISTKLELKELCLLALDKIQKQSDSIAGLIVVEQAGELVMPASVGIRNSESIMEHKMLWHVLKNNQTKVIHLPEGIRIDGLLVQFQPVEIIILPISYKDITLGAIVLAAMKSYVEQMKSDLLLFSQSFALALRNALTHSQLQELAANDPLTNVFNRRFGLIRMQEEYQRSLRTMLPIGVFIADIDHFKSVNDTYGHLIGDRVLVQVSKFAKKALREGDIFMRYGGEEFMAILPGASFEDTKSIAERFRRMIEENTVHHVDQQIKVTISCGVTSYPENGAGSMQSIIELADKKLYQAKEAGRNRVM